MLGQNFLLTLLVLVTRSVFARSEIIFDAKHHDFTRSLRLLLDMRLSDIDADEMVSVHADQWSRLENPSHPDFGKKHHYFVQFADDCGSACHVQALETLGDLDYNFLTPSVGQTFATHEHMKSIFTDSKHNVIAFTPATIATKVSPYVGRRCAEFNEHKAQMAAAAQSRKLEEEATNEGERRQVVSEGTDRANDWFTPPPHSVFNREPPSMPARVLVKVAAMPFAEFEDFKIKLRELAASYGEGKVLLDEYEFKYGTGTRISYFQLNVPVDDSCELTPRLIADLAHFREIMRVEEMLDVHTTNRWSKPICQTNNEEMQPITVQKELNGEGEVVGILDTGIDMSSCYFNDPNVPTPYDTVNENHRKVVQYVTFKDRTDDGGGHGSHVAGTVAGNSTKAYGDFVKYNGMAYNAKIAFFDIGDTSAEREGTIGVPGDLETLGFDKLLPGKGYIITNSWGSSGVNYYSSSCQQSDSFMWHNPEALLLFANGNTGNTDIEDGSVNSPAGAKNVVSVGATLNAKDVFLAYPTSVPEGVTNRFGPNYLAYFSSRGPTADGRVKPDVTAPGWWIVSAGSVSGAEDTNDLQCTIATLQGTSMSTPTVAGYAAMLRQYCREGWYPTGIKTQSNSFTPSGALLKAMLIHSSQKLIGITKVDSSSGKTSSPGMSSNFPNSDYGYGRINMEGLLSFDHNPPAPNDPLTLMLVGGVNGTASDGSTLPDPELYQTCSQSSTEKKYYVKTGSFGEPTGTGPNLKVTLVYTDYPGDTGTSSTTVKLVNKLDVEVNKCSTGSSVSSTAEGGGTCAVVEDTMGSHLSDATIVNPVAQVELQGPSDNTVFEVVVKCSYIIHRQPFALVMTQDVKILSKSDSDFPFAPYESSTEVSINSISADAQVIIVIFSIIAFFLGVLSYIIYSEHKRADEMDEKDLDEQANQMALLQEQQMQQMRAEQGRR